MLVNVQKRKMRTGARERKKSTIELMVFGSFNEAQLSLIEISFHDSKVHFVFRGAVNSIFVRNDGGHNDIVRLY